MLTWKSYYRRRALSIFILTGLMCTAGCQRPVPPQGPTAEFIEHDDVDPLWQASQSVLRKHDFLIDRLDLAAGVIETLPTTSQHFSEFWRQDVADPYSFGQATLHTVQRKATVRFVRTPSDAQWTVELEVDVSRLSTPEHQVTSASSALLSFSGGLPTSAGLVGLSAANQREWVSLGRDGEMESRLMSQIFKAAGRMPVAMNNGAYSAPTQPAQAPAAAPQQPAPSQPAPTQSHNNAPIDDGALIPR